MRFKLAAERGEIEKFLQHNNIFIEQLDSEEKKRLQMTLSEMHSMAPEDVQRSKFYKVSFDEVLELLQCKFSVTITSRYLQFSALCLPGGWNCVRLFGGHRCSDPSTIPREHLSFHGGNTLLTFTSQSQSFLVRKQIHRIHSRRGTHPATSSENDCQQREELRYRRRNHN